MKRAVLLLLSILFLVQTAAAVSWTIETATVHPERTANGSSGVVLAEVVDDDGDPVAPSHCSTMNVSYDYPNTAVDQPMVYTGEPGWFYDDSLVFNRSETDIIVVANGQCGGQQTDDSDSTTVSVDPGGNVSVSFLQDGLSEIAERDLTVAWNATNTTDGFEDGANLSYTLRNLSGGIVDEGSVADGNVSAGADNYTADITLPFDAGWYALVVNASNTSLSYGSPFGGAAAMVDVLPRLSGSASVSSTDDGCEAGTPLECEKGATFEVVFHEETGDATDVNATVTGDGETFREIDLSRYNDTRWNGTVRIPYGFDTTTYGWDLDVTVNATDGETDADAATTLQVQNFTVIESTQPFVRRGNAIDLLAGPVTPFRERPIPPENVSEVSIAIRNVTGDIVNETTLEPPFDPDEYDDERELFSYDYLVPLDATTGSWSTTVQVTDNFSVTRSLTYDFDVLEEDSEGQPVQIAGAGGDTGVTELNKRYNSTGNRTVNVLLNNTANVPALVDVYFTGNLTNVSTLQEDEPVTFAAGQLRTLNVNLSLDEERSYIGNMTFFVHGNYVPEYNLTLPTNLTVDPPFECEARNGSICVTDMSLTRTVTASGDYNLSLTIDPVRNDTLDITYTDNLTDLLSPDEVNITPGEEQTVDLPFTVEQGDQAFYMGNVLLTGNNTSLPLAAEVTVNTSIGRVSVTPGATDLGTHITGDIIPIDLDIENTGDVDVSTITIAAGTLDIDETRDIELGPGNSTTVTVDGVAPDADGQTSVSLVVTTGSGGRSTSSLSITAFRNYSEQLATLEDELATLREDLEAVEGPAENISAVEDDLEQVESLIAEGQQAWSDGDFATARNRYQEAQEFARSADQDISDLESAEGSDGGGPGLPLIPIVVFLVVLGIIGGVVYLSVVPEEEEEDTGYEAPGTPAYR